VSALMSGAMTKIAVYAFVRVTFDLLDHSDWWWGVAVIVLGAVTAVLGILYALFQRDLKTLLAYSTVENIGIIFTAIGLSLAFRANSLTFLAGLALVAALLHAMNHAIFKSLLFFGAGAVLVAAGQRDIERLGGLIHRMPATAPLFLIGCAAISALPPLNGFVSEWLIFQAVLNGPALPQWALKFAVPVAGALLALTAALAAACFVRAFGIVFLGRARSADALVAREVEPRMRAAMALLATLCVVIGVLPVAALSLLTPVVESLTGFPPLAESRAPWLVLAPVADRASSYSGAIVLLMIALFGAAVVAVVRRASEAATRRTPAWGCGFPDQPASAQYSASSFTQPLRRVFGSSLFRARETVEMPEPGDPSAARFELRLKDPIWDGFYEPIAMLLRWGTDRINVLQFLTIRRYLALMFAALVVLLLLVVVLR
jgi:formate hydrogenlyase subunit 3/multisubunit Na+/H+ antiporter MnhD subunit